MENSISVSKVTYYIKDLLEQDPLLKRFNVKGEISNCKYHGSGHIYFTLKDENAALSGVMFAGKRSGLDFKMKDGDKVIVSGNIGVFTKAGSYQIYADKIVLDGEGDLFLKFQELKTTLEEMGMFDESYKQPIPTLVKRVGIVTADTGAAVRDIISVSKRRNPFVELILFPAKVQGEGAAESIVKGIETLDQYGQVDVIIVGRGGGSIEDLWAFNEEIVARAIFNCSTPIISAVGHETDFTIADFVADKRAATPSQAAEFAVCDINVVLSRIEYFKEKLATIMLSKTNEARQNTKQFELKLSKLSPVNKLNENRQNIIFMREKLDRLMNNKLQDRKSRLGILTASLDGLSPLKKLSQGYSFVQDNEGMAVTSVEQIEVGSQVSINVTDGQLFAKIEAKEKLTRE